MMLLPDLSIFNRPSSTGAPIFEAYDVHHLTALGLLVALCVFIAWYGRRGQDTRRLWLGRIIGMLLLGYVAVFYIQQAMLGALNWQYSLPLELCNLALAACILSVCFHNQFASEIAYFWGLGGGLQALATPDLGLGFPSWDYILFFWAHGSVLLTVVYNIAGRNFRPRRGSVVRMMIALNVYGLAIGAIDAVAGWNYGYLCRKPPVPSLLDFLGPWPWYLLSIELIALLSFFLLDFPWRPLLLFPKPKRDGRP